MFAVSTCGPIGCPVSPPPLSSQNKQSHEKSPTSPRARSEAPTTSFVLGTNPECKERVKGKASRIQSNRIGFALGCVRRNAQHLGLKLLESVCVCVFFPLILDIKFVSSQNRTNGGKGIGTLLLIVEAGARGGGGEGEGQGGKGGAGVLDSENNGRIRWQPSLIERLS